MKKSYFSLFSYLVASVTLGFSASTRPVLGVPLVEKMPALPAEVRAYLPRGATSFWGARFPFGPQQTEILIHIWGATRPNSQISLNSYNRFSDSPFCVDVFAPQLNDQKQWKWHLVSSAAYLDTDPPIAVKAHWLQKAKKQGPVLEIVSSNGAPGASTRHTILVWSRSFGAGLESPTPQLFWSGGSGGGMISQNFDGSDQSGLMTITSTDSYAGKVNSTTVYRWDGERFSHTVAAK